jgi:hypothetical protein
MEHIYLQTILSELFRAVASYLTVFPGPLKVRKTTSERSIRACLSWMQLTKTSLRQWWLQCDIKTTTCIFISQFYHIYHVGFSKWPKTESWYRVCLSLYMRISQNSRMVCLSVSHSNWSALFEICSNCNKLIYISTKVWATSLALSLSLSLSVPSSPIAPSQEFLLVRVCFLS